MNFIFYMLIIVCGVLLRNNLVAFIVTLSVISGFEVIIDYKNKKALLGFINDTASILKGKQIDIEKYKNKVVGHNRTLMESFNRVINDIVDHFKEFMNKLQITSDLIKSTKKLSAMVVETSAVTKKSILMIALPVKDNQGNIVGVISGDLKL